MGFMVTDKAVEKLRKLGVFPNTVEENAEVFESCETLDCIDDYAGNHGWGAGGGQFVYFHLKALLSKDPDFESRFLQKAKEELGDLGLTQEHIEEFFGYGSGCGVTFTLRHEDDYDSNTRTTFYEKADQFALEQMREWLGFSSTGGLKPDTQVEENATKTLRRYIQKHPEYDLQGLKSGEYKPKDAEMLTYMANHGIRSLRLVEEAISALKNEM